MTGCYIAGCLVLVCCWSTGAWLLAVVHCLVLLPCWLVAVHYDSVAVACARGIAIQSP
ncbi:hypothetical protein HAX54_011374, partial [Datura stramonium]|nr:hypothetical protein [Datura stramonium]